MMKRVAALFKTKWMKKGGKTFIFSMTIINMEMVHSWDVIGHRVVAELAYRNLEESVQKKVSLLLADRTFAEVSTWADEIKSDKKWQHAHSWHYVNIPPHLNYEKSKKFPQGDLIEAIDRYQKILANTKNSDQLRAEALKFLIHLVGDLHQPLHVGYETDKGGNEVKVRWFKENTNLHRVWDQHLIDHQKLSYSEWVNFLERGHYKKDEHLQWTKTKVLDWAQESRDLLKEVYDIGDGKLGYEYSYRHLDTVKKRLLQAGIRLAHLLNGALTQEEKKKSSPAGKK